MSYGYDFTKEEDVQNYLKNIDVEYRFMCYKENNPEVCHLLGMYFMNIKNDTEQARKVWQVNCDSYKWPQSCYRYGLLLEAEEKPENIDSVIHYLNQGCEAGYSKSCYFASVKMGTKAEKNPDLPDRLTLYRKALELMNRACSEKVGRACLNLSSLYYAGMPELNIKKDLTKVFEYSTKGCESNHLQCCVNASLMYRKGEGVAKNEKLAKEYETKARELHSQMVTEGVQFGGPS